MASTSQTPAPSSKAETLSFPAEDALKLEPHLPPRISPDQEQERESGKDVALRKRPHVTLTFATSLDSSLSLAPGTQTVLSGPQSKAMTHYLRSRHAAICVGVGTAIADDPGLNCRLDASSTSTSTSTSTTKTHQPRPIIIDPHARWALAEDAKVLQLVRSESGLAPFILVSSSTMSSLLDAEAFATRRELLERHGGKYIPIDSGESGRFGWDDILTAVSNEGLDSIMIEGGGQIINSLLTAPDNELIDSVIVTIAPTWLGHGGVVVSPPRTVGADGKPFAPIRLTGTSWHPLGEDVVLCGKILR